MTRPRTDACPTCRRTFNLFQMTETDRRYARSLANTISRNRQQLALKAITRVAANITNTLEFTPDPRL